MPNKFATLPSVSKAEVASTPTLVDDVVGDVVSTIHLLGMLKSMDCVLLPIFKFVDSMSKSVSKMSRCANICQQHVQAC